jgi:hypothetical protein
MPQAQAKPLSEPDDLPEDCSALYIHLVGGESLEVVIDTRSISWRKSIRILQQLCPSRDVNASIVKQTTYDLGEMADVLDGPNGLAYGASSHGSLVRELAC